MGRKPGRPRKVVALVSLEAANAAMYELLQAVLRREMFEATRDMRVAMVQAEYEPQIAAASEAEKGLTAQLQQYYMDHLEEMEKGGRRSFQLTHGVIGRRTGNPVLKLANKSWTWPSVLVRLREKFGIQFVRQAEPEVDKPAVKAAGLDAETLKGCGLRIVQDETFYAEPQRPASSEAV